MHFKMLFASNVSSADENDSTQFFKVIESSIDEARKSSIDDFAEIRDFTYKLILIIVLSISTDVWDQKFKVFSNFKVYYYLGSRSHFKKSFHFFDVAHRTLFNDVHELRRKIKNFDSYDFQIGRILFLTIYETWHNRILNKDFKYETFIKSKFKVSKGKSKIFEEIFNEDLNLEKENDEEKMTESKAMKYISRAENFFYRVICDEAHKLRSFKIKTSLIIFKLKKIVRYLLSATFMINKSTNLYEILMQIFMNEWVIYIQKAVVDSDENGDTVMKNVKKTLILKNFEAVIENFNHIDFDFIDEFIHLFESFVFWKFSHSFEGKQMNVFIASKILLFIFRQIQLRRVMSDVMTVNSKKIVIE